MISAESRISPTYLGEEIIGKDIIIASTEGNVAIPGNEEAKIGLNVYKYGKK